LLIWDPTIQFVLVQSSDLKPVQIKVVIFLWKLSYLYFFFSNKKNHIRVLDTKHIITQLINTKLNIEILVIENIGSKGLVFIYLFHKLLTRYRLMENHCDVSHMVLHHLVSSYKTTPYMLHHVMCLAKNTSQVEDGSQPPNLKPNRREAFLALNIEAFRNNFKSGLF